MGDERLARICAEIYVKHQKALDLIFENKPDRSMELAEIFRAWAMRKMKAGEIEYVPEKSGKTMTRFKTKTMSFLPDAEEAKSGWGTKNYYFYEIQIWMGRNFSFNFHSAQKKFLPICERFVIGSMSTFRLVSRRKIGNGGLRLQQNIANWKIFRKKELIGNSINALKKYERSKRN
ncbi:MAG: hypothetical protein V8Q43_01565 [Christensenellaceae bacterium]